MRTRLTSTITVAAGAIALVFAGPVAAAAQPTATAPLSTSSSPAAASTSSATPAPVPRWIEVSPSSGSPGDRLSVEIACDVQPGAIRSMALTATTPQRNADGHQPWALFATATVRPVAAGRYPVTVTCGGQQLATTLTVPTGGSAAPAPMTSAPLSSQQVRIVPQGAAATGDGSTAANSAAPLMTAGGTATALGLLGFAYGLARRRFRQEPAVARRDRR